jgi:thiamine biosynthesis lipoprotein
MGTSIRIEVSGGTETDRRQALEEAFAAMIEVDRLMSNYRSDSELALANRDAARRPVHVSDPLFSVLSAAEQVSRHSQGAFDVTIGPAVKLWGFFDKHPHVPSTGELEAVRPLVGYTLVQLDDRTRTVRFARPGVELDLGGIAKGFAVELAAGALKRRGLSGFIDAGGNQYLIGLPSDRAAWRVGIQNPDLPGRLLGTVEVPEGSVSTTGGYHNFFEAGGRRYGHVLDPRTLQPSDASLSATVIASDATLADALSKPAFILGPRAGLALVESFPGAAAIIAFRDTRGGVAVAMSERLRGTFRFAEP